MKQFIICIVVVFAFTSIALAGDSNDIEVLQFIGELDQYTPYQHQDRDSINMAIYQYYNESDSYGNVPVIEGDTREYTNSVPQRDAVNLKPAVSLSPF